MKTYLIILALFISFLEDTTLIAQPTTTIDSLLSTLKEASHDTVRFDTYLALHSTLLNLDTARSLHYLREAIELGEEMEDQKRICVAHLCLCHYLWRRGEFESARQALDKVAEYRLTLNDAQINASFFSNQGFILRDIGDYENATQNFLEAISHYEEIKDTLGVVKSYNNIGGIYWELEQLDEALKFYQLGLKKLTDKTKVPGIYGNIGLVYRAKGDYRKALSYYNESLSLNVKMGRKQHEAIDLHNIGVLYNKQKNHSLAIKYFKQAKKLSESIGDQVGVLYADHAMAAVYRDLGYFQKAIDQVRAAFSIAKRLEAKEEIKNLHKTLAKVYEQMGDYQLALEEYKRFEQWEDSLINEHHLAKIKELEVQYETEKKDKQITLLAKEKEIQAQEARQQATVNKALLVGLLLVCTIAGLVVYLLRQRIKNQKQLAIKNEEIRQAQFKQQLSELEMKALRAQMNPHFIFNCINSINRMVLSGEGQSASRYLTKFAKLIRMMLENSENPIVSLKDELTLLKSYLQLESLRFKEKLHYQLEVDDRIDQDNTHLPSMVLQPFIENALWHGLMPKEGNGLIKINIQEEEKEGVLKCVIEDDGVGREQALSLAKSKVLKKNSLGLQITEERLKLLSKEQLKELIRITDLKDSMNRALGTRVDVLIPIS